MDAPTEIKRLALEHAMQLYAGSGQDIPQIVRAATAFERFLTGQTQDPKWPVGAICVGSAGTAWRFDGHDWLETNISFSPKS